MSNKDYVDSTDYEKPLKTIIDVIEIPFIDLKGPYKATTANIQVVNYTLQDSPFNPLKQVQG
jgi:hypothetical protein